MSDTVDPTSQLLQQVRDDVRTMRNDSGARIDGLDGLTDGVRVAISARIDETVERVGRVEDALLDLGEQQRLTLHHLETLSERDRWLEDDITEIRSRPELVEKKLA